MLIARKRSHQGSVCFGLSVAFLLLAGVASATPSITLSRKSGPPTIKVLVSGSGFNPKVMQGSFWCCSLLPHWG